MKETPTESSILSALSKYDAVGCSVYTVGRETGLPRATLERHLRRLLEEGTIGRPFRGQYVYTRNEPDILRDPEATEGIHGWTLTVHATEGNTLLPMVAARLRSLPDARPFESGRWVSVYESWRAHLVEFRVYRTGTLNVYIPATRNPIAWVEAEALAGWLDGKLEPLTSDHLWVRQYGVHIHRKGWVMKDCRAVEFRGWRNAFRQLYERRERGVLGIRDEVHGHQRPGALSLSNAVRILKEGSGEFIRFRTEEIRLAQLEKELELERLKVGKFGRAPTPPPSDIYG